MKTAEQIVDKFKRMSWDHEYAENGILSVTDAIKAMQSFAAQSVIEDRESRWVSVKERLPETETGCYTSNGTNGQIAYLTGMTSTKTGLRMWQEDDGYFHHDITHWQPLPSPPINKG